ncbi:MAG: hypothetical protein J7L55_04140 [Desulfurococcales archaeon]|nr:hypothetical protein [Desulfurococcales archaeon]
MINNHLRSGDLDSCRIKEVREGRLVVQECEDALQRFGLGAKLITGEWVLDVAEAAYLVFTKVIKLVEGGGDVLSLEALFRKYSFSKDDWIRFTVLLDLRSRGRKARVGYSSNTLVLEGSQQFLVFVAEENSPVRAETIYSWVNEAVLKGFNPVIALVDGNGDVTYYAVRAQRSSDLGGGVQGE